jgi:hypothetical protein
MIIHRHMTGPGLCCFRRQTTWRRVWDLLDTEHVGRTTDQSTGGHWRRCTDHDQCGEPCKRAAGGLINKSFSWSRSTCVLPFRGRYRCYICWYQEIKKHMMFSIVSSVWLEWGQHIFTRIVADFLIRGLTSNTNRWHSGCGWQDSVREY